MVSVSCIGWIHEKSAGRAQGNVAIKERNGKAENNGESARCAQAAMEREGLAEDEKRAAERTKKIFTVAVCVILVLALALPTMAVALLGGGA